MSEHTELAATHEPAPTGTGAVILPFATTRAQKYADGWVARGEPTVAARYELLRDALTARAEMGKAKYGTYLRANNTRNALVDLYQELLDAIMYAEQCQYEAYGDGIQYKNRDDVPTHLIVGAEMLGDLYQLASQIAPYIKKAE